MNADQSSLVQVRTGNELNKSESKPRCLIGWLDSRISRLPQLLWKASYSCRIRLASNQLPLPQVGLRLDSG